MSKIYNSYDDFMPGLVTYHTHQPTPYFNPSLYIQPAQERVYTYVDPMEKRLTTAERLPYGLMGTETCGHYRCSDPRECNPWMNQTLDQREDLMAHLTRRMNRQKWRPGPYCGY